MELYIIFPEKIIEGVIKVHMYIYRDRSSNYSPVCPTCHQDLASIHLTCLYDLTFCFHSYSHSPSRGFLHSIYGCFKASNKVLQVFKLLDGFLISATVSKPISLSCAIGIIFLKSCLHIVTPLAPVTYQYILVLPLT